ncbi:tapasin-related protein-like [Erpetoichthys calabaricus]|uniref:tapasin-related protein-like n=1 Tax=Erpetoichthys calabaricus TaxID=27687 RepID=UPI002233E723|nr:tapasin-related protein-like [Erpetoichthys calabaricus]
MKSCSAMRQLSKIVIMFCMLLLPHTTDTRFQMSTQEQNVMTSLNSDVLLPCIFRTQGDVVDTEFIFVTWTHNNKEIARYKAGDVLITSKALLFESELQKGNASFLLKNFQVGDKGEYICHVVDAPDEGQIKVRLEATDTRFQMYTQAQNVISSLNRDVLLPCTFRTQGDFVDTESIIVTWTHNNKEIARYQAGDVLNTSKALLFERELQRGNASLLLKNFQVEDKGEYICHVVDVPDEGQIRIRLEELPKVMIVPDILVRGKDQIINCIIDGHFPEEISITWKKNGVPLRKTEMKDDGTFITTESFILNPVDENDEFTCEVKVMNEIISTTQKFKLTDV